MTEKQIEKLVSNLFLAIKQVSEVGDDEIKNRIFARTVEKLEANGIVMANTRQILAVKVN
jgi:hypothetical protein